MFARVVGFPYFAATVATKLQLQLISICIITAALNGRYPEPEEWQYFLSVRRGLSPSDREV